jgi:hypothetical protein
MAEADIVITGDFVKRVDDEFALLTAVGYQRQGLVALKGVIGNYDDADWRTRIVRSELDYLGLHDVPAGVGTDTNRETTHDYERKTNFPVSSVTLPSAKEVYGEVLEDAPDGSLTLIFNSVLTDAARLLDNEPDLYSQKVGHTVIQAGVQASCHGPTLSDEGFLQPDDSFNNICAPDDAEYLYAALQGRGLRTTFVGRNTVRGKVYLDGPTLMIWSRTNPLAKTIYERAKDASEAEWEHDILPLLAKDVAIPDTLATNLFYKIGTRIPHKKYIDRPLCEPEIQTALFVAKFQQSFHPYDSVTVSAAIPSIREHFFAADEFDIHGTRQRVLGLTETSNGVRCPGQYSHHLMEKMVQAVPIKDDAAAHVVMYSKLYNRDCKPHDCRIDGCDHGYTPTEEAYLWS